MKKIVAVLLALTVMFCFTGCSAKNKPITMVWTALQASEEFKGVREAFAAAVEQATGRDVEIKLSTDQNVSIESLVEGSADISYMGSAMYIQTTERTSDVEPLVVWSDAEGKLDNAYHGVWLAVRAEQAEDYRIGGEYSLDNIQGKKMCYVSQVSSSGFRIPSATIASYFRQTEKWQNLTVDDLSVGGPGAFFSEVLFGGSYPATIYNLLTDKADIVALSEVETANHIELISGPEGEPGAVYAVKASVAAPLDTVIGQELVIIATMRGNHSPLVYNTKNLSAEEVKKIREVLMSDECANNPYMGSPKDSDVVSLFIKTQDERFVVADDAWFDSLRDLLTIK